MADVTRGTAIIAEEIRLEVEAAEADFQSGVLHAIRAGELLIEAKERVKHGKWLQWLDDNFDGSHDTAENYMRLARNSERVRNLPTIREAIALLAAPSDPERAAELAAVEAQLFPAVVQLRANLRALHDGRVHTRLGYPSWGAFIDDKFKGLGVDDPAIRRALLDLRWEGEAA